MKTLLFLRPTERSVRLPPEVNFVPQHWADRHLEKMWRCRVRLKSMGNEQLVLRLQAGEAAQQA